MFVDQVFNRSIVLDGKVLKGCLTGKGTITLINTKAEKVICDDIVRLFSQSVIEEMHSSGFLYLYDSAVNGPATASYGIKAKKSKLRDVYSKGNIKLKDSSAFRINGLNVNLTESISGSIFAKQVMASESNIFGHIICDENVFIQKNTHARSITAKDRVFVEESLIRGNISGRRVEIYDSEVSGTCTCTGKVTIKNSTLQQGVKTSNRIIECVNSTIHGTLSSDNLSLELIQSKVNHLFLKSPMETDLSNCGELITKLKSYVDAGVATLKPNRVIVNENGCMIGNETIEFEGNTPLTFGTNEYPKLESAGFSITANSYCEMVAAIHQVMCGASQTVFLRDSHVETITFEKDGGVVRLIGNSSVGTVFGGKISN